MALVRDPEGVTHFPDFFGGGGLICGRPFGSPEEGWGFINPPHDDPTCEGCMADDVSEVTDGE